MSEFYVKVVEIEKVEKHPNADRLDILTVLGGYPVIGKRDEYKPGMKSVYVSVDALVPLKDARWSFLSDNATKEWQRIKAKKIRNIFSMGILTVADPSWEVGKDVQELLGIRKYEPEIEKESVGGLSVVGPNVPVYDLEGLRKFSSSLEEGEEVILSEKIHGTNSRYLYDNDGIFWAGSHRQFKKEDENNLWWKIAFKLNLREKLSKYPGLAFYGEIAGPGVQKNFSYGSENKECLFKIFDIWDTKTMKWLGYDETLKLTAELGLEMVPELYRGPWSKSLLDLAEGVSTLDSKHVREGFVVLSLKSSWDPKCGRKKFKFIGQGYHLLKE